MSAQSALSACKRLLHIATASLLLLHTPTLLATPAACPPLHYQVLAPHPLVHALATRLGHNSTITIQRAAPERLPASRQPAYFGGRGRDALQQAALQADAIITLRSIWPDDQTWPLARQANIRMIEIDAATPIEGEPAGIALPQHQGAAIALQPWLQSANMTRMASLIASALARLYPDQAATLQANMKDIQQQLQRLDAEATQKLAAADMQPLLALSDAAALFAHAWQLESQRWQADPDANAEQQAQKLQDFLQQEKIAIVLHHRRPAAALAQAISAAGAKLIVLNAGAGDADPVAGLERATRELLAALAPAQ